MRLRSPSSLLVAAALTAAVGVGGCGGGAQVAQVHPWARGEFYLPPPAPTSAGHTRARTTRPGRVVKATAAPAARADGTDRQPSSGAPSDAEIASELRRGFKHRAGAGNIVDAATVTTQGLATVPPTAPAKVAAIIQAANQVARKPYVYGGGHGGGPEGLFVDNAYDCSGSVSFALASAGLVKSPLDSTLLARFGRPGPGKWVTIYANDGHAFMIVAGLRFDTSGRAEADTRWQAAPRTVSGLTVRHPAGL